MAIIDKTRKLLWGRSGNLCAICKCELVMIDNVADDGVVVGDECHIVARKPGGPRGDASFPKEKIDSYENLILLCKLHHKVIDDQPNSYPVSGLKKIKTKHEQWVKINLIQGKKHKEQEKRRLVQRITHGKEILSITAGAHAYDFDYDEPENEQELHLISNFLQIIQDFGDLAYEIDAGYRVKIGFDLTSEINDLEKCGYLVFGNREIRKIKIGDKVSPWEVSVIRVMKKNNPLIIQNSTAE